MSRELTDRVIVITGASSGIGAATAIQCAAAGMDCVINGRREAELSRVADEIRRRGRGAEPVPGDVTEPGMSARLLDTAMQRFGRFDVVFANAGYGLYRPMHKVDEAALRRIFEVNFFAATDLLVQAARRLIAENRRGHLLMCSSVAATVTLANFAPYTATKAAQHHVCRAMRMELRRYGIRVSSVHPTTTSTGFIQAAETVTAELGGKMPRRTERPDMLTQSAEQVARAIVRCLRRPRREVWPMGWLRLAAGVLTAFPRLMDRISGDER
jgi:short-subunit dehydrogenase